MIVKGDWNYWSLKCNVFSWFTYNLLHILYIYKMDQTIFLYKSWSTTSASLSTWPSWWLMIFSTGKSVQLWECRRTDRQMEGRYQVHYLPTSLSGGVNDFFFRFAQHPPQMINDWPLMCKTIDQHCTTNDTSLICFIRKKWHNGIARRIHSQKNRLNGL